MSNLFNTFGSKNTINIGNTAKNALNAVATSTQSVVQSIANNTKNVAQSIAVNTQNAFNNVFKNVPSMNILSPIGANTASPKASLNATTFMSPLNASPWTPHPILKPVAIFIFTVIGFLVVLSFYSEQVSIGWNNITKFVRSFFVKSNVNDDIPFEPAITRPPVPPQEEQKNDNPTPIERIVESILPAQADEVFNVETNEYSYYDAEPLCQALGAELATYDQVKDAWNKGADWCNYGWVKGQVAVYPTQKGTFEKLQNGPAEERGACGEVGLNGGYFDNPEMRFGVNCYGKKVSQTEKAAAMMSQSGGIPKTTEYLQFDKKVQEFKQDTDSLNVLPWSQEKWSDV
jgi:hypothetical protein